MLYDEKIEQATLGAILIDQNALLNITDIITPCDFHNESHSIIFETFLTMFSKNIKIDMLTVINYIMAQGLLEKVGGAFYITSLTSNVASSINISEHAAIIADMAVRRNLILESEKINNSAKDLSIDLDTTIENTVTILDRVMLNVVKTNKIITFQEGCEIFLTELSEKQKGNNNITDGFSPSIKGLSYLIPKYCGGELIIIAGRPGMGKTSFIINEAFNKAKEGNRFLVFSLEMTAKQLIERGIQKESRISRYDMEKKLTPSEWSMLDKTAATLNDVGVYIDDTPNVSFAHIKTKTKIFKKNYDIDAVIIDYIQLMSTNKMLPREQQVAELTRQLKGLAKELGIPIFALCQLNRNSESRTGEGKKPQLGDLRESGAIEQDADMVIFPYRLDYYFKDDPELIGKGVIIVAKNRNGAVGECCVNVELEYHTWSDEAISNFPPINLQKDININNYYETDKPF